MQQPDAKTLAINLGMFKAGWVAAVATAAASRPLFGVLAIAIVVVVHLARAADQRGELLLLSTAAIIGLVWESLLVASGVLQYEYGVMANGLAPYWIVAMWVLFATTLNVAMRWLHRSLIVAAVAGALGGPVSFAAGAGAGAVELGHPINSLLVIGAGWAVLLPLLVVFAKRCAAPVEQPAVSIR